MHLHLATQIKTQSICSCDFYNKFIQFLCISNQFLHPINFHTPTEFFFLNQIEEKIQAETVKSLATTYHQVKELKSQ